MEVEQPPLGRARANTAGAEVKTRNKKKKEEGGAQESSAAAASSSTPPPALMARFRGSDEKKERMSQLPVLAGKKLQAAHLKLSLRTSMEIRALRGAMLLLYQGRTESEEIRAIVEGGASYSQACQAAGRGHQLGPPGPHRARALVQAFIAKGEEVIGEESLRVLKQFDLKWEETE